MKSNLSQRQQWKRQLKQVTKDVQNLQVVEVVVVLFFTALRELNGSFVVALARVSLVDLGRLWQFAILLQSTIGGKSI